MDYHKVALDITSAAAQKIHKLQTIQLRNDQLEGHIKIILSPENYKKLASARRRGKGVRLLLTKKELMLTLQAGGGLKEWVQKFQKFYAQIKPVVGPLLKQGLSKAIDLGATAVSAVAPQAAPFVQLAKDKYKQKAIDVIGKKTGAYGMRPQRSRPSLPNTGGALESAWEGTYSGLVGDNPALHPDWSIERELEMGVGGSFYMA
jgi:hypothetical protein